MPKYYETPCTLPGIQARLRRAGAQGLPSPVRAWLGWMLPPSKLEALGLPYPAPSVAKALERNRRGVPVDGDQPGQIARLTRIAQARSDERSAKALARRKDHAIAESAWADMVAAVHAREETP